MAQDSALETDKNHGITARMPAPTSLWAHLLRKDTARGQTADVGPALAALPPITPSDKNGTSMRILLHDTQAHLDQFSERADKLFSKIDETKREMLIVHTLFQREHQTLTEELVDLVNRSQTQLQNSIGTPAQTEQLGQFSKDVNAHLQAIDKRLDAMHSFNQTHSQLLQLQSQAIQSLQEQHGTILTSLIPLLPLLRAIPLHIESARNKITDILNKPAPPPITQTDNFSVDNEGRRGKRSSLALDSDPSTSPSNSKKARIIITPNVRENRLSISTNAKQGELGSSLRGSMPPVSASSSGLLRQKTTIVPSPRSTPPVHHQISVTEQVGRSGTPFSPPSLPNFDPSPERYPLISRADLPSSKAAGPSGKGSMLLTHPLPVLFPSDFTTPSSDLTRPSVSRAPTRRLWLTVQKSKEETPRQIPKPPSSSSPQSNMSSAKHVNPNSFMVPHYKNKRILIGPACHPAQYFSGSDTNGSRPPTRTALHGTSMVRPQNASALRSHGQADSFALLNDQAMKPLLAPTAASSPMLITQQAKIKERRSPRKEGRRFIPLDDSDDDEDRDFGNG
ncbi:hypothetical protein E4T56_gene15976 [Termitomyces sp. T112]|nr:hypothetical protein E4T56_gene15976 [Termitomyces sp. T112]